MNATAIATESLRQAAAQALDEGNVGVVIGYAEEEGAEFATPLFVRKPEDAARLVFDKTCVGNLAVYLSKSEVRGMGKTGLVVKGCDLRAVNVLIRENVVKRDDVVLIGVCCGGVGDPAARLMCSTPLQCKRTMPGLWPALSALLTWGSKLGTTTWW